MILQSCQPSVRFASKNSTLSPKSTSKENIVNEPNIDIDHLMTDNDRVNKILKEAESWLGVKYSFGGSSRDGVDCSGFVQQVYRVIGENLPRTSRQQHEYSELVEFTQKKSGDLLFFRKNKAINHVGIYIGNGYMIHASTSSGVVVQSIYDSYFINNLAAVGRLQINK